MKFVCPHCGKDYDVAAASGGMKTRCLACQKFFMIAAPVAPVLDLAAQPPKPSAKIIDNSDQWPKCQLCGNFLYPKTLGPGFITSLIFNCIMFFGGIVLCFFPLMFIIGIPMILIGVFKQPKRRKVLACRGCGGVFDRK